MKSEAELREDSFGEKDVIEQLGLGLNRDLLTIFLRDIAAIPMLSYKETKQLIVKARENERSAKKIRGKLTETNSNQLSPKQTRKLISQARELEKSAILARNEIVKGNLRLAISIAKKYRNKGLDFVDLIDEGSLGLMVATKKFKFEKNAAFSTYATWWIRAFISRALSSKGRTIRLPAYMCDRINQLKRVERELLKAKGRKPSLGEMSQIMGISTEEVKRIFNLDQGTLSLDSSIPSGDGEFNLEDILPDNNATNPEDESEKQSLKKRVAQLLATLNPREQKIIRLRFGIGENKEHTLQGIGREFGLTRERIRQIESRTLEKLEPRARKLKLTGS